MAKRVTLILIEAVLVLCTLGLILATWLPIDRVRAWLTGGG